MHIPHLNNNQINIFFDWLKQHITELASNKAYQQTLTKHIKQLHPDLHWEIGPLNEHERFFAFSPNLNSDLLPTTQMLVDKAPQIPGWQFLEAKPKKHWQRRIIRFHSAGQLKSVVCDNWRYFLTSFDNDAFFDVNVLPDTPLELTSEELAYVADLLVELGEALYIQAIDRVNLLETHSAVDDTDNIHVLYEHILSQWKHIH